MTIKTPDRVVELLPSLPEAARKVIVDIAETPSPREISFALTPDEERLLEQAQDGFKHGRTLSLEQFSAEMAAFMAGLRRKFDNAT